MSTGTTRSLFVFFLVVNCILWSRGRYGQPLESSSSLLHGDASLVKRISFELSQPQGTRVSHYSEECQPLAYPIDTQCKHVKADCPRSDTVLAINYLRRYFCTDATLRPVMFIGLLFWLVFLFSTLGISASDFFTPNLSTISQLLGLDENVAGVTFLAFGNGSPDLFSTFSAMRADSGSLALGELLGAATFIVSCVVGSMCIIKPFEVHRTPFLRDVGFFTLAVSLILTILWDGEISRIEAGALVGLYLTYVLVVIIGSWWESRRERKRLREARARDEFAEPFPQYTDDPNPPTLTVNTPTPQRVRAVSAPNPPRIQTNISPRPTRSPSPVPSHITQLPSFSLIGALEFRDVVASLQKEAAGNSLGMFETPVTPYAGGHYHNRLGMTRSPHSSLQSSMDSETLHGLQLPTRGRTNLSSSNATLREEHRDLLADEPDDYFGSVQQQPVPSIFRTPASPSLTASEVDSEEQLYAPMTKQQRVLATLGKVFHTLFPTLHNFRKQSFVGQIALLFATPAVLCLTLTLPVVVTPYPNLHASPEKMYNGDARLVDFEEEGMERVLIAEEEVEENMHELLFSKWLTAIQCVLGPLFCVKVLFGNKHNFIWIFLGTLITGLSMGALVAIFSEKGNSPAARMTRCSMGFFVAIIWIMAIADEVVNVLQTFGFIFGLSDAIIGLTIFAVGNSLADLVANMSVAVFAPIMGFSACFGGPMLNILLGIGISGSYIIHQTSQPYSLELSKTLFVSAFGLLFLLAATLLFVPLNGYFLTRQWGVLLIATYTIIMIINIVVEVKG
ncbi:Putative cation exchanger C3A12.06c [Psilocybe cubensis]|nr:Putative cation exchanger C3A12.06c [Psilocybe cubensis]KAH9481409.1 Putative cation exchanger C3A12.06c [Psilocybe cubensis]